MSGPGLAKAAQTGFASAAAYEAHRPSFPADAVEQFLSNLEVVGVQGAKIADLAAGTGKFTEILSARPEQYEILAIEPHDGMREQLEKKQLPRVKVIKGFAESMADVADGSLEAVVTAQASYD
jgi:ubiquinone/menaquinone biosynthesis C-methylase UbiE